MLGDSLFTRVLQQLMFPGVPDTSVIMLHPIGLAGWLGLYSNLWQLLPIGRFDGGRLAYALWGYERANMLSWLTILVLALLGTVWAGWWVVAACAAFTMIRIRTQHPIEHPAQAVDAFERGLVLACAVVLALTFVPEPIGLGSQPDTYAQASFSSP